MRQSFSSLLTLACAVWALPAAAIDEHTRVSDQGFGPIKIGMTVEEASKAAGAELIKQYEDGAPDTCYYAHFTIKTGPLSQISFMIESEKITAIEVSAPDINTTEGAHVGMISKEIEKVYKGKWAPKENIHGRKGDYDILVTTSDTPNGKYGYMFRPNDDGRIEQYSAGELASVQYSEGCL